MRHVSQEVVQHVADLLNADFAEVARLEADNRALETIIEGAKCRLALNMVGRCDTLDDQLALMIQERNALQAKLAEATERERRLREALKELHEAASDFASSDPDMPSHDETCTRFEYAFKEAEHALREPADERKE